MEPEAGGRPRGRSGTLPVDLIEQPNRSRPGHGVDMGRARPIAPCGARHSTKASRREVARGRADGRRITMRPEDRMSRFADWRPFASLRTRPPGEKRFLILVPLTGAA